MLERTITQFLNNPAASDVLARIVISMYGSRIEGVLITLNNQGDEPVMYDYTKCEPILLDRGEHPFKIIPHMSWLNPNTVVQHHLGANSLQPLDNLEYLEWKYERQQETL